uniref:Secreted protein n=1 Tax=Bursaphelenchus xylophilus TaxID=6326 RepID=A0A1I7SMT6_BURXY
MRNKTLFLGLLSTFFWIQDVQADRADQGLFFPCSLNRRIWDCIGKKTEIPSVDLFKEIASSDSDITHLTSIQSNNRKLLKPVNFYGAYLNKARALLIVTTLF